MIAGAVDIGTNSVRWLVVDGANVLDRRVTVTRLGQGVAATGRLDPAAVARTLACLREAATSLDQHDVERRRAVATAVLRDVTDGEVFLAEATRVLGVEVEVLSGDEEARLSFSGATSGLDPDEGPFLVVDIGGGSTELSVGTDAPAGLVSLPFGSVRLTESLLHHDPPRPEELTNAIGLVEDQVADAVRVVPELADARTLVGVAGTIVSVAAVELGYWNRSATHHLFLSRDTVEEIFRTLATEPLAERVHNPGLQPERADIIVGGCCVLVGVLRKLRAPGILVSENDLLDALVAGLGLA